jgi:hypothetical protein
MADTPAVKTAPALVNCPPGTLTTGAVNDRASVATKEDVPLLCWMTWFPLDGGAAPGVT